MLRPYRLLAAVPHAPSVLFACLVARLYQTSLTIVITFLIADWTGSYAAGGATAGAFTIGQAIAGPVRGRAVDRRPVPRVLVLTGAGSGLVLLVMAAVVEWTPAEQWWAVVPVALAAGTTNPPLSQLARAVWPRLADGEAREAAYTVEATAQELLFVTGPMLAATVVATAGPKIALLSCAGWSVLGTSGFAAALWRAGVREGVGGPANASGGGLWRVPGFVALLGFSSLLVGALISADVLLVGFARERHQPQLAGVMSTVWALGSLLGGLVVGGIGAKPRIGRRAVLAMLGLCAVAPAVSGPPLLFGAVLCLAGSTIAPVLAAYNGRIAELTPPHRRGEAFGWSGTAITLGGSLASPVVGAMLDRHGLPAGGAVLGALAVGAVLFMAGHLRRTRPAGPGANNLGPALSRGERSANISSCERDDSRWQGDQGRDLRRAAAPGRQARRAGQGPGPGHGAGG